MSYFDANSTADTNEATNDAEASASNFLNPNNIGSLRRSQNDN